MWCGSSALSLPSPLLAPPLPPRRALTIPTASSIPSPKPLSKRRNHLRPKLQPLLPRSPSPVPPPPPPPPILHEPPPAPAPEAEVGLALEVEVEVAAPALVAAPLSTRRSWFPTLVLDLCLRFAALLAVQTLVAVWFLGRGGGNPEATRDSGDVKKEEEEEEDAEHERETSEFDKRVIEIRAMANEARISENVSKGEESGVEGEVGRRLDGLRKRYSLVNLNENGNNSPPPSSKKMGGKRSGGASKPRKRLGFVSSAANARDAPKGFNGSKAKDRRSKGNSGGIEQIVHQNFQKESLKLHEAGEVSQHVAEIAQGLDNVEDLTMSSYEDRSDSNQHTSNKQGIESLEQDHGARTSNDKSRSRSPQDIESRTPFEESSKRYAQANIRHNALQSKNELTQPNTQVDPRSGDEKYSLSALSRGFDGRSGSTTLNGEVEQNSTANKDKGSQYSTVKKLWWLKLPYVLAVYLRRGSDRNGPCGLYSLKMDFQSHEEMSPSYTVAFQDRGDATNFCYLLESHFDELGDVTADVVPLTNKELDDAVKSGDKVIVVKKGQLKLFAGQPLFDIETALRSLISLESASHTE